MVNKCPGLMCTRTHAARITLQWVPHDEAEDGTLCASVIEYRPSPLSRGSPSLSPLSPSKKRGLFSDADQARQLSNCRADDTRSSRRIRRQSNSACPIRSSGKRLQLSSLKPTGGENPRWRFPARAVEVRQVCWRAGLYRCAGAAIAC